ncbi:PREDICTED: replication protein A 14 kDa subunit A-like [Lupinus angustifolius]|uniref:replication protein A 14 kDa subunit A-like n=1 Tax=Lupinus angustifolius TaxID=3871 RepID=UPI00092E50E6|nr:PREDICTED: replication protein A 14 kDa subunit A-like [Lupinus angustifolius]
MLKLCDKQNSHTQTTPNSKLFLFQFIQTAMDTSNPAAFVNAQLLSNFIGKKVRTVVQVNQSHGGVTIAKSTDNQQLTVTGLPPVPLMNFVEVIGIAENNNSINAEIWTDFGNTFDTNSYNQLCLLANGEFKGLFL